MQDYQILIEKSLKGDQKSQRRLYDVLKGKLFGICLRYNKRTEDANDVFQEAMIRLFKNLSKAEKIENFDGWIRRIVTNAAIDAYKKRKKEALVHLAESDGLEFSSDEVSIVERLEASELLRLLQNLPSNQQVVFNLYMIDGYSHKEIAEQLEVAESTSRVLLTRAKKMMIELLKKTEVNEQSYG